MDHLLRALPRLDPAPDLLGRILSRLPPRPRPAFGRLQWALGSAAVLLLGLGAHSAARAGSAACAGSRAGEEAIATAAASTSGAGPRVTIVDDPGLLAFSGAGLSGSEPFDPLQPWSRGEPGGGP